MQGNSSESKSSTKGIEPPHPQALAYSIAQAAMLLSVSQRTIYNLIYDGKIITRKLGSRRVVPRVALERLLSEESER